MADAALGTADQLAALGPTLCLSRVPATATAGARVIQEAVARDGWEAIGSRTTTQAPTRRPATCDNASEGAGARSGKTSRAMVVHATAQDKRRLQRLARDLHASAAGLQAVVRVAATHATRPWCANGQRPAVSCGGPLSPPRALEPTAPGLCGGGISTNRGSHRT